MQNITDNKNQLANIFQTPDLNIITSDITKLIKPSESGYHFLKYIYYSHLPSHERHFHKNYYLDNLLLTENNQLVYSSKTENIALEKMCNLVCKKLYNYGKKNNL